MKLQQLRYLKAIVDNNLNVTEAAQRLFTSQPGVSKQIRLLEEELGLEIFHRCGKHFTHVTPAGMEILARADRILREVANIQAMAEELRDEARGTLAIASTHTQARYFLPPVISRFRERYPGVHLRIHQGDPEQIALMAVSGQADFAIATEAIALHKELIMLPAYRWRHGLVVPRDHELTSLPVLTLEAIAAHPIVTYVHGFTGRGQLERDFKARGLSPEVVLGAVDSDVIKTYVRLGLGVGIIAHMAYDPKVDVDLVYLDADGLFSEHITRVGLRRGNYLRGFMRYFMALVSPHFDESRLAAAMDSTSQEEVDALLAGLELPVM